MEGWLGEALGDSLRFSSVIAEGRPEVQEFHSLKQRLFWLFPTYMTTWGKGAVPCLSLCNGGKKSCSAIDQSPECSLIAPCGLGHRLCNYPKP